MQSRALKLHWLNDESILPISVEVHRQMVEVAREFRKVPTPSESLLWQGLRGRKLRAVKFRRQQPIGPFVVDFFCAQYGLVVEVDGPIHATQVAHDRERQRLLEACGYRVLRISAAEVEQAMGTVVIRVKDALITQPNQPRLQVESGSEVATAQSSLRCIQEVESHAPPAPPHIVRGSQYGAAQAPPSRAQGEGPGVREPVR